MLSWEACSPWVLFAFAGVFLSSASCFSPLFLARCSAGGSLWVFKGAGGVYLVQLWEQGLSQAKARGTN